MDGSSQASQNSSEYRKEAAIEGVEFTEEKDARADMTDANGKMDAEDADTPSILMLPDDCLYSIFMFVKNPMLLMVLEKVCERFSIVADMVYKTRRVLNLGVEWRGEWRKLLKNLGPCSCHDTHESSRKCPTFVDFINKFGNLREFCLTNVYGKEVSFQFLAKMVGNLKMLKLVNCDLTDDIGVYLQEAKHLEILDLSNNHQITGKCLVGLRNIKEINIAHCNWLNLSAFKQFCEHNPELESINFGSNFMKPSLASQYFRVAATHLKSLERFTLARTCNCDVIDYSAIGEFRHLKHLTLSIVPQYEHVDICLTELAAWETLERLCLRMIDISGYELTPSILRAITSLTKLKVLSFERFVLTDEELTEIASSKHMQNLEILILDSCVQVSDDGILMFIRNCRSLTRIMVIPITIFQNNISGSFIYDILPFLDERPNNLKIYNAKRLLRGVHEDIQKQILNHPKLELM